MGVRSRPERIEPGVGSRTSGEYETVDGGTWHIAGARDYWSKYEYAYHLSPTANQRDAIAALKP